MSVLTLACLRASLDGAIPAEIATCDPGGTTNVSAISDVHYVDAAHVAISYQFFSKTRANILANPRATVLVKHPQTCAQHRLQLHYLHTETEGPLFETMKAKLAGIASHEGIRLLGADVYRVIGIEAVRPDMLPDMLPGPAPRAPLLPALRRTLMRLAAARDLDSLIACLMQQLETEFHLPHAMLLMADAAGERLCTVASLGYPESGIGAEILPGQGIFGVAAREKALIRIARAARDDLGGRAVRDGLRASPLAYRLETEIPLPGICNSASQIALPLLDEGRLLGILYAESPEEGRFGYDEEDALVILAGHLEGVICRLAGESEEAPAPRGAPAPVDGGAPLEIRHYAADDSVFVDGRYVIKGVAGAILWLMVSEYRKSGRIEFSNRELRLSPQIRLPEFSENLEARLILLRRRLAERCRHIALEKAGRGRIRLAIARQPNLIEAEA